MFLLTPHDNSILVHPETLRVSILMAAQVHPEEAWAEVHPTRQIAAPPVEEKVKRRNQRDA